MFTQFYEYAQGPGFTALRYALKGEPKPIEVNLNLISYFESSEHGCKIHFSPSQPYANEGGTNTFVTASYEEVLGKIKDAGLSEQFLSLTGGGVRYGVKLQSIAMIREIKSGSQLALIPAINLELKVKETPDQIRSLCPRAFYPKLDRD